MEALKTLQREGRDIPNRPVKILQFGEGNFLRAFVDWMIDILNEKTEFKSDVQIVQPLANGMGEMINKQDGLYHVWLEGLRDGKPIQEARLINCVRGVLNPYNQYEAYLELAKSEDLEFVISNTTEAGIAFDSNDGTLDTSNTPNSFPAKVTTLLHQRYQYFDGAKDKGLTFIPVELIDKNGAKLKETILQYIAHWQLNEAFKGWVEANCTFCNTLVDRIVPGFPKDTIGEIQNTLGYDDNLVVKAEPFHLWVIEAQKQ